jgi:acyl dehydratase
VTADLLYADDLTVGRRFDLGSHTLTAEEITTFAGRWDPLPFHVDVEAAEASHFGGLIASGLHTMAVATRLQVDAVMGRAAVVAGRGVRELNLLKPVHAGTTLTGWMQITEQRLREDGRGVVVWHTELTDETGEPVVTLDVDCLMRRRPATGRPTG